MTDQDTKAGPCQLKRNNSFYLDCITFLVEDELFKVPIKCISFDTEPFQTLASRSLPAGDDIEGLSDEKPIKMEDTSIVDFERLLLVLCPFNFKPKPITSVEVWSSVLRLATRWRLLDIRRLAVETMSNLEMTSGELVRYGREHRVDTWLVKGYLGFVTQESPLSEADAREIRNGVGLDEGINAVLRVAALRERKPRLGGTWKCSYRNCSGSSANCNNCGRNMSYLGEEFKAAELEDIRREFKEEVDELVAFEKYFYLVLDSE